MSWTSWESTSRTCEWSLHPSLSHQGPWDRWWWLGAYRTSLASLAYRTYPASLAWADEVDGIADSGRPVETLPEGVSNESPWSYVVAASPWVYVLEEHPSFLDGDASLKNPYWASTIQLLVVAIDDYLRSITSTFIRTLDPKENIKTH